MSDDPPPGSPATDPDSGTPLPELVDRVHAELRATAELPVEREASRWIGEAEAVAADAADGGLDDAVVRERVGHVADLLSHVESTGHDEADARVETARRFAEAAGNRGNDSA